MFRVFYYYYECYYCYSLLNYCSFAEMKEHFHLVKILCCFIHLTFTLAVIFIQLFFTFSLIINFFVTHTHIKNCCRRSTSSCTIITEIIILLISGSILVRPGIWVHRFKYWRDMFKQFHQISNWPFFIREFYFMEFEKWQHTSQGAFFIYCSNRRLMKNVDFSWFLNTYHHEGLLV